VTRAMRVIRVLALGLLAAGCGGASGSARVTIAVHDDLLLASDALAGCAQGDVAAQLQIVADLRDSYHEMIVCGGLSMQFNNSIESVIANALLQKATGNGLVYQGDGVFATPNGVMWIRTSLADSPIGFNVLDPHSYLAGLTVSANVGGAIAGVAGGGSPWKALGRATADADVQISFRSEGPGFALLGITAQEARSGKLPLARIKQSLGSLIHVENRVSVDNRYGTTTVRYKLQSPPIPVNAMTGPNQVPMQLHSIEAVNPSLGQTMTVTTWTMDFKGDGGKVLDGTIGMDIDGGAFPYHVEMTYPHRMEPDIRLSCRAPAAP
jgi:hypothetical protein